MPSGLLALLWRMPSVLLVSLRLMSGVVHAILLTGSLASSHRFGGCPTACHRLARIALADARQLTRVALGQAR